MIWIIGEYAERIDNADELLATFLEGFQDENAQVCLRKVALFNFSSFIAGVRRSPCYNAFINYLLENKAI